MRCTVLRLRNHPWGRIFICTLFAMCLCTVKAFPESVHYAQNSTEEASETAGAFCPPSANYIHIAYTNNSPRNWDTFTIRLFGSASEQEAYRILARNGMISVASFPLQRIGFTPNAYAIVTESTHIHVLNVICSQENQITETNFLQQTPYMPEQQFIDIDTLISGNAGVPTGDSAAGSSQYPGFILYSWHYNPRILIFDTEKYAVLSQLFKRLAFFIEKEGYSGTIYEEAELANQYAWRGHNYNGTGLAEFYNTARSHNTTLNEYETLLLEIILTHKIILERNGLYFAGEGGVLGVSRESSPFARQIISRHELLHGVFYSYPDFREAAYQHWLGLAPEVQDGWREILRLLTYDPSSDYLVINEMQAYLLAKPLEASVAEIDAAARRVAVNTPEHADLMEIFLRDNNREIRRSAEFLRAVLQIITGLEAGKLSTLLPSEDAQN